MDKNNKKQSSKKNTKLYTTKKHQNDKNKKQKLRTKTKKRPARLVNNLLFNCYVLFYLVTCMDKSKISIII